MARRILANFADPFAVKMTHSVCGASIGYAIAPRDGSTLDALLRNADLALYEAKGAGAAKSLPTPPPSRTNTRVEWRSSMSCSLPCPMASSRSSTSRSSIPGRDERLLRSSAALEAFRAWTDCSLRIHPDRRSDGAHSADRDVGSHQRMRRGHPLERRHQGRRQPVAGSVQAGSRARRHCHGRVTDTGLAASRLDLEVTKSVLIDDSAAALAILEELRSKNIGVSLDDFGTGFASLAYLNDFPFSKIKIDRKFSQNVDLSPRTSAIIKGIAQTTRDLPNGACCRRRGDGGPTRTHAGLRHQCDSGLLFSKPLPDSAPSSDQRADFPGLPQPRRAANALETGTAQSRVVNCGDYQSQPARTAAPAGTFHGRVGTRRHSRRPPPLSSPRAAGRAPPCA